MKFCTRWLIRLLVLALLVSVFPSNTFAEEVSNVNYYPGENKQDLKDLELTLLIAMPEFQGVTKELDGDIQTKAGQTKVIKEAVRYALKNKHKLFKTVEIFSNKRTARSLEIRWNKYVEPGLKELLKWDKLVWRSVKDAIYRALRAGKLSETTSESISFWVVEALKWIA
ncbi:hypothetical protein ACN6A9_16615 [Bacillus safensis]|uniref:hypothetical protein n=1 Tax=Bacillus TaxID=1386 RepID=UPI001BA5AFEA|nr:hypothetical protein [Bacillus safensis]MBR0602455.1 hypothetical protein [Bacillus safensis]